MHYSILWIIFQKSAPRYWRNLCFLCADIWYGNIFAKWVQVLEASHNLQKINNLTDDQLKMVGEATENEEEYIIRLCEYGKLETLIWFDKKINLHTLFIDVFGAIDRSVKNGHLEINKWLWYKFQRNEYNSRSFINIILGLAAENGHLEICKWVIKKIKPPDRFNAIAGCYALADAANNGHLHILKWLAANCKKFWEHQIIEAFTLAAKAGHVEVIDWMAKEYELNIGEIRRVQYKIWHNLKYSEVEKWFNSQK